MSELSKVLEIFPPALMPITKKHEEYKSKGHSCPYCNGIGYTAPEQIGYNEWKDNTCPICMGSGRVKANILVSWEADDKK